MKFDTGQKYSKKDIYNILNVPKNKQKGIWNTGYTLYDNSIYIFANINSAGRTGHNYDNKFIGDDLQWFSKNTHSIDSPTIQRMLNDNSYTVYIFTREDSSDVNFTYRGIGSAKEIEDSKPVRVLWEFIDESEEHHSRFAQEVYEKTTHVEGATKKVEVNVYERDPTAREKCIKYHGVSCNVCGFNFESKYGDVGKGFIHVHHLKELSSYVGAHEIDPVEDLRPVCPNCHEMLHKKKPPFTVNELKGKLIN